ncbi:sulfatase-like hydrolase/transferase [Halobellus rarus]|uniref:Sulfatase-like hydrolase/transferase n=1 Tax=Halobellus rarus TaxID=1126237 RepID=A0ABD6CLF3_9EURY|nr:sulfatase-like hydrolase/transferase [Halobellus rarus]
MGGDSSRGRDIVLLTIDCWRHDAPARMPRFRRLVSDFERGEAICQAAATNGVFPTVLASQFFHNAYREPDFDAVADGVTTLPALLSESGYETGAFIASNPFLGKWAGSFDTFWNDGMSSQTEEQNRSEYTQFDRLWNLLRLQSRVRAEEIGRRARKWFRDTDSPRFLWMHLMDVHGPYYPGLRRGLLSGLVNTYRSIVQFSRDGMDASESVLETIERLYWQCVRLLDEQMAAVLEFVPDDATVIVMADHGEELYNGYIGHARLYDECVRVPFYVRDPGIELTEAPIRQMDLAPTIAERFDLERPADWRGEPYDGTARDSVQVNHSHLGDREMVYLAHRTADAKLIESYDADGEKQRSEFYGLRTDPNETHSIDDPTDPRRQSASDRLSEFRDAEEVVERVLSSRRTASETVEKRLEELGYR